MTYPTKQTAAQAVTEMQNTLVRVRQEFVQERDKVAAGDDPVPIMDRIMANVDARIADLDAWAETDGFNDEGLRQYPNRQGDLLTLEYASVRMALMECYTVQKTEQTDVLAYMDAVIAEIEDPHG